MDCNSQFDTVCARLERDRRVPPPPVVPATARRRALRSRPMHHVNHAGEVCAQALYVGQALTSR